MTPRRDFPPPRPAELNEKLPQPLPPPQRDPEPVVAEPQPAVPVPIPTTLAETLSEAAQRGVAGRLLINNEAAQAGPNIISNALAEIVLIGHFARDGRGPAGTGVMVGRTNNGAGRYVINACGLGTPRGDWLALPNTFGPDTLLKGLEAELDALHRDGVPMVVVFTEDCFPPVVHPKLADRLAQMAADVPACFALMTMRSGLQTVQWHEGIMLPKLRAVPGGKVTA